MRSRNSVGLPVLISGFCAGSVTAQAPELSLVEELRLGRVDGSGPDVFANIDDLAVDTHDRIYVADVGWRQVRLFDRDGRFVRTLAPEGDGPGERRYWPAAVSTRITWDPHRARLWIDDGLHLLALDSLGAEYARATRNPGFLPSNREPMGKVFRVDANGRLYEVLQGPSGGTDSTYVYMARGTADSEYAFVPESTLRIETRGIIRGPPRTRQAGGGTLTATVNTHDPPRTVWAVSPAGELWGAGINEPHLWELSFRGDTLRTISSGASGSKRMELDISPEGWFWLRREPASDAHSTWDLLDNCGAYLGFASIPHNVSMTEVGADGRIHAVAFDALGVEYVLRLRLQEKVETRRC